jgi:tetratricopeptide (TPR) repeat protein
MAGWVDDESGSWEGLKMEGTRGVVVIAVALVAVTLVVFAPTFTSDFVNFDDPEYVTANPGVQAGLSWSGIRWAMTTDHAGFWHPLTWLSLQADASLYGPKSAGGFHLTNVLLHAAAAVLLLLAMRRLTGTLWRAALVAALFAVHPLHVESVAWVAERKDVLSGLFWMLTLLAYARYAERPTLGRSLGVVAAFALGLMAKPMLVTLPCVLLLLDWWPLRRPLGWRLLVEKVPLFALVAVMCVVTVQAQRSGGAVVGLAEVGILERLVNALLSYCAYLARTFWPANLAVLYPWPERIAAGQVVAAGLLLAAISGLAVYLRRPCPYLLVGWLWFVGTLVPVIGLVQVGSGAWADRFSYLPHVGLFVAVVWGGADALARWPRLAVGLAVAVVLAMSVVTWRQVLVWHDSLTLWEQAAAVARVRDPDQASPLTRHGWAVISNNLGSAHAERGNVQRAIDCYRAAVTLDPDWSAPLYNLAGALTEARQYSEAAVYWEGAVARDPEHVGARVALAMVLTRLGRTTEAADHLIQAGQPEQSRAVRALVVNPAWSHWSAQPIGATARRQGRTVRLREKHADRIVLEVETAWGVPEEQEIPRMVLPSVSIPPHRPRE